MADFFLSKLIGGGGLPIRALIQVDDNAPLDFSIDGQRYLALGLVETDTNLFDTDIWDQKGLVTSGVQGVAPSIGAETVKTDFQDSSNNLIISTEGSTANSMAVSQDGGLTWSSPAQAATASNCVEYVELDSGDIIGLQATGTRNVHRSNDLFATVTTVDTAAAGSSGANIVTDGSTIVVTTNNATQWRYSTDDGDTWSNTSTNRTVTEKALAYGNNVWVAVPNQATSDLPNVWTSADGITWAEQADVAVEAYTTGRTWVFFNNSTNLFQRYAQLYSASGPWVVQTSADGVTWADPVEVRLVGGLITFSGIQAVNQGVEGLVVVKCTTVSGTNVNDLIVSSDGGFSFGTYRLPDADDYTDEDTVGLVPYSVGAVFYSDRVSNPVDYVLYAGNPYPPTDGDNWQDVQGQRLRVRIS